MWVGWSVVGGCNYEVTDCYCSPVAASKPITFTCVRVCQPLPYVPCPASSRDSNAPLGIATTEWTKATLGRI